MSDEIRVSLPASLIIARAESAIRVAKEKAERYQNRWLEEHRRKEDLTTRGFWPFTKPRVWLKAETLDECRARYEGSASVEGRIGWAVRKRWTAELVEDVEKICRQASRLNPGAYFEMPLSLAACFGVDE